MKKVILGSCLGFLAIGGSNVKAVEVKPNILFFLVDDMGWMDVGFRGSKLYETPNIDKLAKDGVVFNHSYATHSLCLPSRYAMMTGRHPARVEIPGGGCLSKDTAIIAQPFKKAGYTTYYAGKWHLTNNNDIYPHNSGFDINIGGGHAGEPGSYFFPYTGRNHVLEHGLDKGIEGEYITDRLTRETTQFIRNNSHNPFFAVLAHYAVHTPIQAKKEYVDYYRKKNRKIKNSGEAFKPERFARSKQYQDNAEYAAMIHSVDESLGKLVQTLKEEGLYDNTIILFTSDHGGLSTYGYNMWGVPTSNEPLRAGKCHLYEGGIRIPTLVHWPQSKKRGIEVDYPITGTDYFPSLLEMAGLALRPEDHLDGESFAWTMESNNTPSKERSLFWHTARSRPRPMGDLNASVIRKGDYKLIDFFDIGEMELYDLSTDHSEAKNLAWSKPEKVKELLGELNEWRDEVNALERPLPSKPYQYAVKNGKFEYGSDMYWSLKTGGSAQATAGYSTRSEALQLSFHPQYNSYKLNVTRSGEHGCVTISSDWHNRIDADDEGSIKLTLECYAKSEKANNELSLQLAFKDAAGQVLVRKSSPMRLSDEFKKYSFDFLVPDNYTHYKIELLTGRTAGITFFDYVSLFSN